MGRDGPRFHQIVCTTFKKKTAPVLKCLFHSMIIMVLVDNGKLIFCCKFHSQDTKLQVYDTVDYPLITNGHYPYFLGREVTMSQFHILY